MYMSVYLYVRLSVQWVSTILGFRTGVIEVSRKNIGMQGSKVTSVRSVK